MKRRRRRPRRPHPPAAREQAAIVYAVTEAAPAMSAHFAALIASPRAIVRAIAPHHARPE